MAGENGSGKSTLLEAIAVHAGFNAEGGGLSIRMRPTRSYTAIGNRGARLNSNRDGYFLRAESFYNVATEADRYYGEGALHRFSHGGSFPALFTHRLFGERLYILDEPDAAMSLRNILAMPARMKQPADLDLQFIVTTRSHVPLAYPGADIFPMTDSGPGQISYEDTDRYRINRYFCNNYCQMIADQPADGRDDKAGPGR
ncbi:MAG: AAA family ATPase [Rikenellaceae bacterium]|nr:AAA family ATPase [Rikenellaceae bacterium]